MKVLSVEEMQSDLVQGAKQFNEAAIENRRQEIAGADVYDNLSDVDVDNAVTLDPPENLIKDFPFKNNWYELVLKRLIRYAADNGFDAISIPKAQVIQDRYSLTRRVNELNITAYFPERQEIGIMGRDQNGVTQIDELFSYEKLKKDFGEDTQKNLIDLASKSEMGDDLKVTELNYKAIIDKEDYPKLVLDKEIEFGGEGKARLYNKTIPSFLKKYGKKWNAKVYDDNVDTGIELHSKEKGHYTSNMPVTILEVTPEMKQSVQETPQALFSYFGGTVLGYEMVKDNIENNIISQPTENMY
jgi:hypothetical protein